MIDFNIETLDVLLKGLSSLKTFSLVNPNLEIPLNKLSLSYGDCKYNIDYWPKDLIATFLLSTITKIDDTYIKNAKDIFRIYKENDRESIRNLLELFHEEYHESSFKNKKDKQIKFCKYAEANPLKKVSIYSSLFNSTTRQSLSHFSYLIPWLLEQHLSLSGYYLEYSYLEFDKESNSIKYSIFLSLSPDYDFELYLGDDDKAQVSEIFFSAISEILQKNKA